MKQKTYLSPTTEIYLVSADELMTEVVKLSPAQKVTGGELNANQMGMEEENSSMPQMSSLWEE